MTLYDTPICVIMLLGNLGISRVLILPMRIYLFKSSFYIGEQEGVYLVVDRRSFA